MKFGRVQEPRSGSLWIGTLSRQRRVFILTTVLHRVSYPTTGKPGYGKRLYYTTAGNRIKEKIYNTYEPGSSGNGWSDGTLDISTIPGSNFDAICWNESSNISLRVYVQEGQQASAISEWIRDRDFAPGWALGIAALPPATQ